MGLPWDRDLTRIEWNRNIQKDAEKNEDRRMEYGAPPPLPYLDQTPGLFAQLRSISGSNILFIGVVFLVFAILLFSLRASKRVQPLLIFLWWVTFGILYGLDGKWGWDGFARQCLVGVVLALLMYGGAVLSRIWANLMTKYKHRKLRELKTGSLAPNKDQCG